MCMSYIFKQLFAALARLGSCIMFTACSGGVYGSNCSLNCGNCFESQQCHHINGTCMNGCDHRYQGLKCIEGKDNSRETEYRCVHVLLKE